MEKRYLIKHYGRSIVVDDSLLMIERKPAGTGIETVVLVYRQTTIEFTVHVRESISLVKLIVDHMAKLEDTGIIEVTQ